MTLITINPSASNHDASQDGSGVITLTGEIKLTAAAHWCGLLLAGVSIPTGATVNSATLYYKAYKTTRDDPAINWYGEAADNAGVFTTGASDISGRSRTTAYTGDTATGIGTGSYRTVNIKGIVDEVRARGGWSSGNNIALIGDPQSACDIWINAYDTGANIWYVEIDYTAVTPQTVTLNTLSAAVSAVSLAVAPGVVVIAVNTLNAALSGVQMAVVPGARAVALNTLAATLEAVDLTVAPGGVVILLDTHAGTLSAVALSVQGAANIVVLDTLTGNLSAVSLTVLPGEAVASLNTLIGLLQVMDVSIGQGIVLSTLSAALSAVGAAVAPGEAVVNLASLAPVLQAVGLSVAPGAVSVDLDTLNALLTLIAAIDTPDAVDVTIVLSSLMAALSVTDLGAIPGDMVIELQTMAAHMTLYDLLVFVMLGYAMHGTRAMSKVTMTDYAPMLIRLGDTEGRD